MSRTLSINVLDFKQKLLQKLRTKYIKQHEQRKQRALQGKVSVSDLIHCMRQVTFRHLDPDPQFSEKDIKMFHGGEEKHKEYQALLNIDKEEFACEREFIHNNLLVAHPDVISLEDGAIIEIKTTETDSVLDKPHLGNVRQLKAYLAIVGAPYGKLFYTILGKFKRGGKDLPTFFPEYMYTLKPGEREEILQQLEDKAEMLLAGINLRDPSVVDHIATNKEYIIDINGYKYNWMCGKCDYKKQCNEMRAKAGEFQRRADQAQKKTNDETFAQQMMKIPESWRPK